MTDSRAIVLARIRQALADGTPRPPVPRAYRRGGESPPGTAPVIELLVDRLLDYRAEVVRTTAAGLADAVDRALAGAGSVVVPPGLAAGIRAACARSGRSVTVDGTPDPLGADALDRIDAVVTGARVAVALTGTIVLDGGPDQGRRAITLVPDRHVVVLRADQVVQTVPEAIERLDPDRPLTMIAGPSATSDIELERVEGVHGPRRLQVVLVEEDVTDPG